MLIYDYVDSEWVTSPDWVSPWSRGHVGFHKESGKERADPRNKQADSGTRHKVVT